MRRREPINKQDEIYRTTRRTHTFKASNLSEYPDTPTPHTHRAFVHRTKTKKKGSPNIGRSEVSGDYKSLPHGSYGGRTIITHSPVDIPARFEGVWIPGSFRRADDGLEHALFPHPEERGSLANKLQLSCSAYRLPPLRAFRSARPSDDVCLYALKDVGCCLFLKQKAGWGRKKKLRLVPLS